MDRQFVVRSWAGPTALTLQGGGGADTFFVGNGTTDDLTGLSGSGRYVRMNGVTRGTAYGYSLYEMQVYGTA